VREQVRAERDLEPFVMPDVQGRLVDVQSALLLLDSETATPGNDNWRVAKRELQREAAELAALADIEAEIAELRAGVRGLELNGD